ncbi:MAG TPA: ATP-grasp domain-containing protein [Dongiaceae bacterium]|jgi:biotin carboxylase|nr:ATP-grasp domain-containing protein [Dongiaceae bacterium]
MPNKKTVVVGYSGGVIALQQLCGPGDVIVIEEPDVVRKRNLVEEVKKYPVVGRLIEFEYQKEELTDQLYNLLKGEEILSIIPLVEYATLCAARLADLFKVPSGGYEANLTLREKNRLRNVTSRFGIKNPKSQLVFNVDEVKRFAAGTSGPIIIKAGNRQASVGAVIVRDRSKFQEAWEISMDRDEGVLVPDRGFPLITLAEQFVVGNGCSVELLVSHGRTLFSNVTLMTLFEGDFPVWGSHIVPAPLESSVYNLLVKQTQQVVAATGFDTGIIHCEWIWDGKEAYLIECAGRFPGDGIGELIQRAYGFDIIKAYVLIMRGEDPGELPASASKTAMIHFIKGQDGKIAKIDVDDEAFKRDGVDCHLTAKVGDLVRPPRTAWQRLGSIMLEAPNAAEARERANRALSGIRISYGGA